MPKRKKQTPLQPPPQVPEPEEAGDPVANGKPGDPTSALRRGPRGPRGRMIPPLPSLPPPPRGRGPVWGGLGPRSRPHGRGWGVGAEPPSPGPDQGSLPRGGFHKERRHPGRLQSWSLVKNASPLEDEPPVLEDKSNRPVCRHFAKGHCLYEDLCAFYHPGVNGPPL
ncbi:proline-rich protein 3-like [Eptesicus fuscus]|uniref:proline-rich protein 3-like n=1 Tax=Eptesicus fuscus TaxID=29078 RepID=UPI0024045EFC|nr:proline-rich protein 3-like [Eptesicus fuscus]